MQVSNWKCFADTGPIALDQINILVGRNNAGKSALIQAIHQMQNGAEVDVQDLRIGQRSAQVVYEFGSVDFERHFAGAGQAGRDHQGKDGSLKLELGRSDDGRTIARSGRSQTVSASDRPGLVVALNSGTVEVNLMPQHEPENFIYPYLSRRKVVMYDTAVDIGRARSVLNNLQYMVSKIAWLANFDQEQHGEYSQLCEKVLGFRISAIPAESGQRAGIPVRKFDRIYIEDMGEGVPNMVGLIADLCMAENNLFLIEELENDIHPEGLKTLLDVIVEKSETNQFIISTHSNVVTRHLGAAPKSRLFVVRMAPSDDGVPTSTVQAVDTAPGARIAVLRELGYELYDFFLWDGWLILEEATAERIIRDFLIPQFAPKLSRVRTVAAGGTSKAGPTFEDFRRLFLFAHLEEVYHHRAWVVIDGDESGKRVIVKLQQKYQSWNSNHFRTWTHSAFERYYPERFQTEVDEVLTRHGDARREAKKALVEEVIQWCDDNPETARDAFAKSAAEVIDFLVEVETMLLTRA